MANNLTAVISADTTRFTRAINEAQSVLSRYSREARSASSSIDNCTSVTDAQVTSYQRLIRSMQRVANGTMTTSQAERALSNQIQELRIQWANLTDEARSSDFGRALSESMASAERQLEQLRTQIRQTREETSNIASQSNGFSNLTGQLDQLSNAMGTLGFNGSSVISTLTSMGGLLANPYVLAGAAITGASVAVADYGKELDKVVSKTQNLTGLSRESSASLAMGIKSVCDVYDTDFNEALSTANAMARQMGISFDEALNTIEVGFAVGADSSGDFLDQVKEYSPYLKEAGISAEGLVSIIAQSQQQGIFTDKAVDAIKEANLRLREMPQATQDALNALGLSVTQIQSALRSGTTTTFKVMQQVSEKLNELPANANEVGQAMADIFGGPGEDAGLQYLQSLKDINLELDGLKENMTASQKATYDLQQADKELQNAMASLFGVSGDGWNTMATTLKTKVYRAITTVINAFIELYNQSTVVRIGVASIGLAFKDAWAVIKAVCKSMMISLEGIATVMEDIINLNFGSVASDAKKALSGIGDSLGDNLAKELAQNVADAFKQVNSGKIPHIKVEADVVVPETSSSTSSENSGTSSGNKTSTDKKTKIDKKPTYKEGSLGKLEAEISNKQSELKLAVSDQGRQKIQKEINDLTKQKEAIELSLRMKPEVGSLQAIEDEISSKQKELKIAISDTSRNEIQKEIDELTGQKNTIELKLKPAMDEKSMEGLTDKITEHNKEKKNIPIGGKVERAETNADNLKEELEYNEDLVKSYKEQYNAIQLRQKSGISITANEAKLVSIYDEAKKKVDELTDSYNKASKSAESLRANSTFNRKMYSGIKGTISTIGNLNNSITGVTSTWQNLADNWGDMSTFDQVTSSISAVISTISEAMNAYESINDVIQLFGEISEASAAKKVAADATEMASDNTKTALDTANTQVQVANNQQEQISDLATVGTKEASAIASATASGASLPFPANLAAIAAGIAAVVAAFAMISSFADGGIIGGSTTIGDMNLARVNKGEMILNGTQQKRLFSILDGTVSPSSNNITSGNVKFEIKGSTLVGVLKNHNAKMNRIG